jgi:hypothetical protein
MRSEGEVSNEVMNRTLRELDLKEARLAVSYSGGRIRTCDLRVMSLIRWVGWTTWRAL